MGPRQLIPKVKLRALLQYCVPVLAIAAIWAIHFYASSDMVRAIIISVSVLLIGAPIVVLRRMTDNVNTMLNRLRDLDIMLAGAEVRWRKLDEAEKLEVIQQAKHKTAHLLTYTMGWHELAREREAVIDKYDKKLDI